MARTTRERRSGAHTSSTGAAPAQHPPLLAHRPHVAPSSYGRCLDGTIPSVGAIEVEFDEGKQRGAIAAAGQAIEWADGKKWHKARPPRATHLPLPMCLCTEAALHSLHTSLLTGSHLAQAALHSLHEDAAMSNLAPEEVAKPKRLSVRAAAPNHTPAT